MRDRSKTERQKLKFWHVVLFTTAIFVSIKHPVRAVKVEGNSMLPTYTPNQTVWCIMPMTIHRGSIVVVNMDDHTIIKRVAHIGGDRIFEINVGDGFEPADTRDGWRKHINDPGFFTHSLTPCRWYTVPRNTVYLLGDNLPISEDSRSFGPVPIKQIEGVVL